NVSASLSSLDFERPIKTSSWPSLNSRFAIAVPKIPEAPVIAQINPPDIPDSPFVSNYIPCEWNREKSQIRHTAVFLRKIIARLGVGQFRIASRSGWSQERANGEKRAAPAPQNSESIRASGAGFISCVIYRQTLTPRHG